MHRRLLAGISVNLADKIIVAIVQLSLVPAFAQSWGSAKYSAWLLLAALPSFFALSDFGLATAAGTLLTMQVARRDTEAALTTFWTSVAVVAALGTLFGTLVSIILFFSLHAPSLRPLGTPTELRFTAIAMGIYGVIALQGGMVLAGFRSNGRYVTSIVINAGLTLVEGVAVLICVKRGASPADIALLYLGFRSVGVTLQFGFLLISEPWIRRSKGSFSLVVAARLIGPSLSAFAVPSASAVALQGTALAIGSVAAAALPGFSAARTLSRVGIQATGLVSRALMPEMSMARGRDDRHRERQITILAVVTGLTLILPLSVLFDVFGVRVVHAWTHGAVVVPQLLIHALALSMFFSGLWQPLGDLFIAMGRQAAFSWPYLFIAGLTVAITCVTALYISVHASFFVSAIGDAVMLFLVIRIVLSGPVLGRKARHPVILD